MKIADIMSREVITTSPDEDAEEAWKRMTEHRVHHLVVMRGEVLAGIISDRDLGGPHGAAVRHNQTVARLMTPYIVSARPTMTVEQAAGLLQGRSISCLPVLDGGTLEGIVTVNDLLRQLATKS